jgi:hypothetical protein
MGRQQKILAGVMMLAGAAAVSPALAQWSLDQGTAIVSPSETNSNAELLAVSCGEQVSLEIFARGGAVRPNDREVQPDYFSRPDRLRVDVDGRPFAIVAEATDAGIALAGKASRAGAPKPVDDGLIEALRSGSLLTVAIDAVAGENGPDGSPYETVVRFPLAGSKDAIDAALAGCRGGA